MYMFRWFILIYAWLADLNFNVERLITTVGSSNMFNIFVQLVISFNCMWDRKIQLVVMFLF